jgi:hypothetical protein
LLVKFTKGDKKMGRTSRYSKGFLNNAFGQQFPPGMTPTGKPGEFYIEGVGVRVFADIRQDMIWDRVGGSIGTAITAGETHVFFRDTSGKSRYETSMRQQSSLPEGQEALIYRIGAMPDLNEIVEDQRLMIAGGLVSFVLDDNNTVKEGPMWTFPCAWGVYGNQMTTDSTTDQGALSNGVPSAGANPRLMIPHYLSNKRTFRGDIVYKEAVTIAASDAYLWMLLDALITRPVY